MLSVNYSLNCTTFDPKGKILQVSTYNLSKPGIHESIPHGSSYHQPQDPLSVFADTAFSHAWLSASASDEHAHFDHGSSFLSS